MNTENREEFEILLRELIAGYDRPMGDRMEAYWKGLAKMSLIEFARVVEFALGESGPDRLPGTKECWKIRNDLRRGPQIAKQTEMPMMPKPQSIWLRRINKLFFKYIQNRRLGEEFKGDIDIGARRLECLSLIKFCEDHDFEMGVEVSDYRERFGRAMEQLPDRQAEAA